MALFIVFEGGEGCGKSTQTKALYRRLSRSGIPAVVTREPGGTGLGERLRRYLKRAGNSQLSPASELFLIAAARAQLVSEIIRPGLKEGKVVICDRYTPSTLAYQGYGRGLNLGHLEIVNHVATGGLSPDLIILLDMPVDAGLSRKKSRGQDRFENESLAFHTRVRRGYLDMATSDPELWVIVDGRLSRKEIQEAIWHRVGPLLQRVKK